MSAFQFDARGHLFGPAPSFPLAAGGALRNSTPVQRRWALVVCVVLLVGTAFLSPFASVPLPKIPGFFAIYQTAAIATCLLTAFLMYGHFRAVREVALLHLSAGYLYTAAVLVMQLASRTCAWPAAPKRRSGSGFSGTSFPH
ncbi:hypothetical protein [Ramlibacter sp.]|uniref:hypothetical protein n=1 Tax=Ramlibacter sp. TaxID=1917967 RepID=UPI00185C6247|nr:hypothetical protein [Ramlibacter sp.]MBA2674986.1 hypothetical protein [Ramlibacter sp.]